MNLNSSEKKARAVLVEVAKTERFKYASGLISYKEFWEAISKEKWGRARVRQIVRIVTRISAYEIHQGRPPLNELVVNKLTQEPGEPWVSIKNYLIEEFEVKIPYSSHRDAQIACWRYWQARVVKRGKSKKRIVKGEFDLEVEEGLSQDRTAKFRKRNSKIIRARKRKDKNTCQSCNFKLQLNGLWIIDCHHRYPLGWRDTTRVTSIDDLICLCPNCHRISHSEKTPLTPDEIKAVRRSSLN